MSKIQSNRKTTTNLITGITASVSRLPKNSGIVQADKTTIAGNQSGQSLTVQQVSLVTAFAKALTKDCQKVTHFANELEVLDQKLSQSFQVAK